MGEQGQSARLTRRVRQQPCGEGAFGDEAVRRGGPDYGLAQFGVGHGADEGARLAQGFGEGAVFGAAAVEVGAYGNDDAQPPPCAGPDGLRVEVVGEVRVGVGAMAGLGAGVAGAEEEGQEAGAFGRVAAEGEDLFELVDQHPCLAVPVHGCERRLVGAGRVLPRSEVADGGVGWPLGKGSGNRTTNHHHNVFWRLNFTPDGAPAARVEQIDSKHTGSGGADRTSTYKTTRERVTKERGGNTCTSTSRWWHVVSAKGKNADGHPRSWELVHQNSHKYTARVFTNSDVYFTRYKKNEQYASDNDEFGRGRPATSRT